MDLKFDLLLPFFSRAAMYVAGRLAPDYASLYKIMAEMKKRDPQFSPLTLLDFGSGVGTSMW